MPEYVLYFTSLEIRAMHKKGYAHATQLFLEKIARRKDDTEQSYISLKKWKFPDGLYSDPWHNIENTLLNLNYLPLQENVISAFHKVIGEEIYKEYPPSKTCRFIDKDKKTLSLGFCSAVGPFEGVLGYFIRPLFRELRKNKDFKIHFITGEETFPPVDILFDLNGHTHGQDIGKKFNDFHAPVQITWLGYPNTTGLKTIDYRLTSDFADPLEWKQDSRYTETLLRMPKTFLCFSGIDNEVNLEPPFKKNGFITFACTNNAVKINTFFLRKVKTLLDTFKDSKIVFRHFVYSVGKVLNTTANDKVKQLCLQVGIDLKRVKFSRSSESSYLESYNNYDIALDTSPYSGTTTTFETLWMGVPVITFPMLKAHRAHVTRMILQVGKGEIDTSEWIVTSDEQLLKVVTKIADVDYLTNCRENLREQLAKSPLGDAKLFAENFTKTIWLAWEDKAKRQSQTRASEKF